MVNKVENVSLGSQWDDNSDFIAARGYCGHCSLAYQLVAVKDHHRDTLPGLEKSPASSWYTKPTLIKVPLILFCEVVMLHLATFSGPKYTPFNTRINLVNTGIDTRSELCGHRDQQRQSKYSFLLSCLL